jgi:RNA recognition motif-containing protein
MLMSKRLFVGNLPYKLRNAELRELFAKFGNVLDAHVVLEKGTNKSKGFGFVELDDDAATAAISELNNAELEGRKIAVNEAKPREERPRNDSNYRSDS